MKGWKIGIFGGMKSDNLFEREKRDGDLHAG